MELDTKKCRINRLHTEKLNNRCFSIGFNTKIEVVNE